MKAILTASVIVIFIVVFLWILTGQWMTDGVEPKANGSKDYAIILGAKVNGETPSLSLQYRLDAALDYAIQFPHVYLILSGGQGARGARGKGGIHAAAGRMAVPLDATASEHAVLRWHHAVHNLRSCGDTGADRASVASDAASDSPSRANSGERDRDRLERPGAGDRLAGRRSRPVGPRRPPSQVGRRHRPAAQPVKAADTL